MKKLVIFTISIFMISALLFGCADKKQSKEESTNAVEETEKNTDIESQTNLQTDNQTDFETDIQTQIQTEATTETQVETEAEIHKEFDFGSNDYKIKLPIIEATEIVRHGTSYKYSDFEMIIPAQTEPPVRTLRATIPENESH